MTDQAPATEAGPTTSAGRIHVAVYPQHRDSILAIEAEARASLDVDVLARAFVRVIDRRPTKVEVTYFYGDAIPVEHQREAFLRNVTAEYRAILDPEQKP